MKENHRTRQEKVTPRQIIIRVVCLLLAILMVAGIAYATLAGIITP